MTGVIATRTLIFLSLASSAAWANGETEALNTTLDITSPAARDRIIVGQQNSELELPIQWKVPESMADQPVRIRLMQGNNLTSMYGVYTIASSANNNGSYHWYSSVYVSGDGGRSDDVLYYGYYVTSGCNFTIELKSGEDVSYSDYFTVANAQDDTLSTDAQCLSGKPSGSTLDSPATTAGSGSKSVSQTTLIIAAAVPVLALLVAFSLILYLGIRRSWFVRKSNMAARANCSLTHVSYDDSATTAKADTSIKQPFDSHGVQELNGETKPYAIDGNQVYQLSGEREQRI